MMDQSKYAHKILVVEDDAAMMDALTANLKNAGFNNLLIAKNGVEALEIALKNSPDLIILDIILPKMDGMTVLKKIREEAKTKKTKVIILTNLSATDTILSGIVDNEPSYFLIKAEHSIDEIMEKVKSVLQV